MLSQSAKREILRRISVHIGYEVREGDLSPDIRRAVTSLASVLKHLSFLTELQRGEKTRIEGSVALRTASKLVGRKDENVALDQEISKLHTELEAKIAEVSERILGAERKTPVPPGDAPVGAGLVQLKCPRCGAPVQLPSGSYLKCQYCGATLLLEEMSSQISSAIRGI
jgi:DNA-directed RNA polymerase subunit RPC12/RpoP